jgi:hypothetical protein
MADDRQRLEEALIAADKAGDIEAATALAAAIRASDASVSRPEVNQTAEQQPKSSTAPVPLKSYSWGDVPGAALKNAPASAGKLVTDFYDMVSSPVETAKSLAALATGKEEAWGAVKKQLLSRYGGEEELKRALAEDPVGVMSDFSTGALAAGKLAKLGGAAKLGQAAEIVSNVTDPFTMALKGAEGIASTAGKSVAAPIAGITTGAGSEVFKEAFKAGNNADTSFWKNLTDTVPQEQVLVDAHKALSDLRAERNAAYEQNIASTAANTTPLDFKPIDDALTAAKASLTRNGKALVSPSEMKAVHEVEAVLDEWRADPTARTAMDLDGLKQRLDAVYPNNPQHTKAQRVITQVRNAVSDTIVKQSPEYAKTMGDYSKAMDLESEITKALSLGDKASKDTAIRKLLSMSKDTSSSSKHKKTLIQELERAGGKPLMPAIAGQAASSWLPHSSMSRATAGAGGLASLATNPALAGFAGLASPRLMAGASYGAGRLNRMLPGSIPTGQGMLVGSQMGDYLNELEQQRRGQ